MRDYFDKPEHLGRTVSEYASGLGVDTNRVRIRVRTIDGETIETIGFNAQDLWIEVATPDETIRVLPWSSVLGFEIYVAADEAKPPVGFSSPGGK